MDQVIDDRHPVGVVVGPRDKDRYPLIEADIRRAHAKVAQLETQLTDAEQRFFTAEGILREKEAEIAALKADFAALKESVPNLVLERIREALTTRKAGGK